MNTRSKTRKTTINMRHTIICIAVITLSALHSYAQKITMATGVRKADLPVVYLPDSLSVHFISPEPIQYVDISANSIAGDLPVKNILRIKYRKTSQKDLMPGDAVVTIAGEKFIAQYHVVYSPPDGGAVQSNIEIRPEDTQPLDQPGITYSQHELKQFAASLITKRPERYLAHSEAFNIRANLNHVYVLRDYIFLDLGFENKSKLSYDIDALRFKIDDKKITKATTVQSCEIKPELTLFDNSSFKKHYRNVFVFKKVTFPGSKVLKVELSEKQLFGRVIKLSVSYKDLLNADIVP